MTLATKTVETEPQEPQPVTINEHKFIVTEMSVAALRSYLIEIRQRDIANLARYEEYEAELRDYEKAERLFLQQELREQAGTEVPEDERIVLGEAPVQPSLTDEELIDQEIDAVLTVPVALMTRLTMNGDGRPLSDDELMALSQQELESIQKELLSINVIGKKILESRRVRMQRAASGI